MVSLEKTIKRSRNLLIGGIATTILGAGIAGYCSHKLENTPNLKQSQINQYETGQWIGIAALYGGILPCQIGMGLLMSYRQRQVNEQEEQNKNTSSP